MPNHKETAIAPIYTIDLSLRPKDRYKALAVAYRNELQGLATLFNDLFVAWGLAKRYHAPIRLIARVLLRRVFSSVETAELRGIAEATGIPIHLLISFNLVLDCLMGCTSGAVKSLEKGQPPNETRMLHFRTLDWGMDDLRKVLVQLEFVRTRSATPGKILARSITYVGFIGVLTAVREDLSISLNFRSTHNATSLHQQMRFYLNHVLVLLGCRQSIASILRGYIISEDPDAEYPAQLEDIVEELVPRPTTAAYLTFCDGVSAVVMEKDHDTAVMRFSDIFLGVTNHDQGDEDPGSMEEITSERQMADKDSTVRAGMKGSDDSRVRLNAITSRWRGLVHKAKEQAKKEGQNNSVVERNLTVTTDEVIDWVSAHPTTNCLTHFATIMDPMSGQVFWTRVYTLPMRLAERDG